MAVPLAAVATAVPVVATVIAVVAPGDLVDEAVTVVAQGRGVGVVVPHVRPPVLVQARPGVAADAGVDTDRDAAVQTVVVEGVGVAVLVREDPARPRCSHRHARHRPAVQPRPHGVTPALYETKEAQGRWLPASPPHRVFSRCRTRCPRCPASGCTSRCRRTAFARGPRRAGSAVCIRPQVRRGVLHPRVPCRPAHRDAPGS